MTPPVTVIVVPVSAGARGYGCKTDGESLFLPYNKLIVECFADVPMRLTTMLRDRFNTMERGDL